jgi:hypothetical protein
VKSGKMVKCFFPQPFLGDLGGVEKINPVGRYRKLPLNPPTANLELQNCMKF